MKCPNCTSMRWSSAMIRILGLSGSTLMIVSGILSFIIVSFNFLRLFINVFLILFGFVLLIADIYAFQFFGYLKFVYHPVGRGLCLVFMGLLITTLTLWQVIVGVIVIAIGILYGVLTFCNGGVPKPIMQRSMDELPLNTELRFVDVQRG